MNLAVAMNLKIFGPKFIFLENLDISCCKDFKGVKGRLAKHIEFWMNIGASDFVLDTIRNGYVIPLLSGQLAFQCPGCSQM
jgi:hypothetical protein